MSKELLATMDAEHETMAVALAETRAAMGALTRTAGLEESNAALAAFQKLVLDWRISRAWGRRKGPASPAQQIARFGWRWARSTSACDSGDQFDEATAGVLAAGALHGG